MPYSIDRKNKCVYKKKQDGSRGEKVGCTKGSLDDYIAALQIHAEGKKTLKEQKETIPGAINQLYAVQKPYTGCELTSLVKPIDPLLGIGGSYELAPDQVHAVYADEDMANDVAGDLFEEWGKKEKALEEKKGSVTDKLKKAIDVLEKKRKEHMDMAKEDPKNSSKHKEEIAKLVDKIDDFMTKLEKVEKSKKNVESTDKKEKTDK